MITYDPVALLVLVSKVIYCIVLTQSKEYKVTITILYLCWCIFKRLVFPFKYIDSQSFSFFQEIIKNQGCRKVWTTIIRSLDINKRSTSNFTGIKVSCEGVVEQSFLKRLLCHVTDNLISNIKYFRSSEWQIRFIILKMSMSTLKNRRVFITSFDLRVNTDIVWSIGKRGERGIKHYCP